MNEIPTKVEFSELDAIDVDNVFERLLIREPAPDDSARQCECGEPVYWDAKQDEGLRFCWGCFCDQLEIGQDLAKVAVQELRFTQEPEPYDSSLEYSVTPEEYDSGFRESYTPNAYQCYLRHSCTNYDDLMPDKHSDEIADQVVAHYGGLAARILTNRYCGTELL